LSGQAKFETQSLLSPFPRFGGVFLSIFGLPQSTGKYTQNRKAMPEESTFGHGNTRHRYVAAQYRKSGIRPFQPAGVRHPPTPDQGMASLCRKSYKPSLYCKQYN